MACFVNFHRLGTIILAAALSVLLGGTSLAEIVSINRGAGLGYVFTHRNNCYLILPAHVHGRQTRLSIATAAPVAAGDAEVFRSFAPALDLSLAIVTGGLDARCTERWSDLPRDAQSLIDSASGATLYRLDGAGNEDRIDMVLTQSTLETLTAEVARGGGGTEIFQGTSGGALKIDGQLVGLAIQSEAVNQAVFLRADEIVARLSRILEARDTGPAASQPAAQGGSCVAGVIPLRQVSCDVEPTDPAASCSALANAAGPAIFPPGSRPRLIADLDAKEAVAIGGLSLATETEDGRYSPPQSILVELRSGAAARWRRFAAGDVSPLGQYAHASALGTKALQIRLSVLSAWDPSLPLRIDCLALR